MTLSHIALQNLRRRPGKTILLFLTFAFIVATISSLTILAWGMQKQLQESLANYGANVVISPRAEHLTLSYGGLSVSGVEYEVKKLEAEVVEKITQLLGKEVIIGPKVIGLKASPRQDYMIIGLDFGQELKMKPWWTIEGKQPEDEQVVLGFQVAKGLQLGVGDTLDLGERKLPIVGVMAETGGSEDQGVFTTIKTARNLLGIVSEWSLIELNAANPAQVVANLKPELPMANVTEVTQLVEGAKEKVERFNSFSYTISWTMGLIGALVVIVTLAGNVNARLRELGVLRAIGFRRAHILTVLGLEAALTSLTGSFFGYLFGMLIPLGLGPFLGYKDIVFAPQPGLGMGLVFASLLVGLGAIIYPGWRVLKMDLQEALKYS